jgi:hypothetical protein
VRGADVDKGVLLCTGCRKPANTLHLLPWSVPVTDVRASCGCRAVGGWWCKVTDNPDGVLQDLAEKPGFDLGSGPTHAIRELVAWLGHRGLTAWRYTDNKTRSGRQRS